MVVEVDGLVRSFGAVARQHRLHELPELDPGAEVLIGDGIGPEEADALGILTNLATFSL